MGIQHQHNEAKELWSISTKLRICIYLVESRIIVLDVLYAKRPWHAASLLCFQGTSVIYLDDASREIWVSCRGYADHTKALFVGGWWRCDFGKREEGGGRLTLPNKQKVLEVYNNISNTYPMEIRNIAEQSSEYRPRVIYLLDAASGSVLHSDCTN